MFKFDIRVRFLTRLVVNLARVHQSETYISVFKALSVDIQVDYKTVNS